MIAILILGSLVPMTRIVLGVIAIAVGLPACGGDSGTSNGDSERVDVAAAFYPLAWATERVAHDSVRLRNLTPPGTEPHDVELTARDVERIRSADVVLYLGGGFQPAVEDAVDGASGTAVDLLEDPVDRDPHVWLDPVRFAGIVERIADAIDRPEGASAAVADLRALDRDFTRGLSTCKRREIVTAHEAFGYLARRYRLEQVAITGISPEAEPTPRQLEDVIERVRQTGATTIFFETLVSPRLAETVARETGAGTAVLNPIEGLTKEQASKGEDYISLMRDNLASLRHALGCR
jgi:zinc transport system substrate-binding protein